MSALCHTCGDELYYDGDCPNCTIVALKKQVEELKAQLQEYHQKLYFANRRILGWPDVVGT